MWMRSVIFLSCCLFPLRSDDLYLKLLVATPQTLITGNTKHVREPEWIWKRKNVPLRKWKSPHSHQWWTIQSARISLAARRLLNTLQSRWRVLDFLSGAKGREFIKHKTYGCLTDWKGGSFHTYRHTLYWTKRVFFPPKKGEICFLVFGYCTWGPSSWKRASISQMAELMWAVDFPRRVFFFLLRDLVSALVEGVECEKQSARQCAAGWGKKQNKKSIKSKAN